TCCLNSGVNFFLAIKQKTPNRWVSNFRGSLQHGGFFILLSALRDRQHMVCAVRFFLARLTGDSVR
ncbi:hypothetical protein, partial [Pantoea agglomerans]|uniref:hypothetical protein n=1 Tax=Enterobacter agglomerans TaxID=549 RepID=UPI001A7E62A5